VSEADERARRIARRIWPGDELVLAPLSGGITNQNYRVDAPAGTFVVRLFSPDAHHLLIDRSVEEAATRSAAAIGVSPEVVAVLEDEAAMVTRFVVGSPISLEAMGEPATLARVGRTLRRVHDDCAPVDGEFDPHRLVERYRDTAAAYGVEIPRDYGWAHDLSARIERACGPFRKVLLHADLLNANLIDDGEVRIVDWEYAGMGNALFDLANLSINHGLTGEQDALLLAAYADEATPDDLARICLLRFMSAFRETMWAYVQAGVSAIEFDFLAYGADYFARMHEAERDPRFPRAFALLEA
jgi:thiamine kinase-like enzyme